jgi:hypothetical protein
MHRNHPQRQTSVLGRQFPDRKFPVFRLKTSF